MIRIFASTFFTCMFVAFISVIPGITVGQSAASKPSITFSTSDKKIQQAFDWASAMALKYRGNPKDKVGPWYEAALPSREAFCMRDVSHQSIAAEILGMSAENENM